VRPHPQPCSSELLEEHLAAFIDAFVSKHRRERARLMLIDKPTSRSEGLRDMHAWLDSRFADDLDGQETFAQVLAKIHNNPIGVFMSVEQICCMKLDEAVSEATFGSEDGLFSVTPGKLAFWFSHHGDIVRCTR
jgi:hypothetical protein